MTSRESELVLIIELWRCFEKAHGVRRRKRWVKRFMYSLEALTLLLNCGNRSEEIIEDVTNQVFQQWNKNITFKHCVSEHVQL